MNVAFFRWFSTLLFVSAFMAGTANGQDKPGAHISGSLSMDETWDSEIFLSHIPTFEDMYVMSNEMIIARTAIDSLGCFQFNIDFLPEEDNLYRLHMIKKEDTPATLIIGGKDENHFFLIANRLSQIHLSNQATNPPFRKISFENSTKNTAFHQIIQMVFTADSIAAEGSASKRLFIENQLHKDLLVIADTSGVFLVSLFAIYQSGFAAGDASDMAFYKSSIKRWDNQNNGYLNALKSQLPVKNGRNPMLMVLMVASVLAGGGFFIMKSRVRTATRFEKLSIQERKIYELLQQGASNQEISNHFNIGLSTVKSHVSSIYSKLNVKSRKDIANMNKKGW